MASISFGEGILKTITMDQPRFISYIGSEPMKQVALEIQKSFVKEQEEKLPYVITMCSIDEQIRFIQNRKLENQSKGKYQFALNDKGELIQMPTIIELENLVVQLMTTRSWPEIHPHVFEKILTQFWKKKVTQVRYRNIVRFFIKIRDGGETWHTGYKLSGLYLALQELKNVRQIEMNENAEDNYRQDCQRRRCKIHPNVLLWRSGYCRICGV